MKKLSLGLVAAMLLLISTPGSLKADDLTNPVVATEPVESAEVTVLVNRLEEIKAMDKSDMAASEKKELRKEVNAIKGELKELGGGVYISVGAIIIILLLLIILL
jgi:hypothetical protein